MFWFLCTLYHNISKDSNSWLTNWIFLKWICFDFLAEWTLTWRQWCTVRVWRPVGRQSGSLSSSSTRSPRWPLRATDSSTLSPAPNRLGCSAGRRTVLKWRKLTFSISYISKMSKELNCLRVGSFWRIWYKLIHTAPLFDTYCYPTFIIVTGLELFARSEVLVANVFFVMNQSLMCFGHFLNKALLWKLFTANRIIRLRLIASFPKINWGYFYILRCDICFLD